MADQKLTRIILDASKGDLAGQVRVAEYCIARERPSDGISFITARHPNEDRHFAVKWNKVSLRIYPQWEGKK